MKSSTLVSVEEYLASHYDPDRDYVDGELVERNVGEYDLARLQMLLAGYLLRGEKKWNIRVLVEQRVQVRTARYRVPDICVIHRSTEIHQILDCPPFLCIEVLSPNDSLESLQEHIDDYLSFGVAFVWVVSPKSRRGWIYTADSIREAKDGILRTSNPDIEVPLAEVFDRD